MTILGKKIPQRCAQHEAEEVERREQEERERLSLTLLLDAGGTKRLKPWSLDTYREECDDEPGRAALAVAERWLRMFEAAGTAPNLLLYGPVGGGKSGLAWGMVRHLCEQGVEAKYVVFRRLLEDMKDAYAAKLAIKDHVRAARARVVVLDDLGSERPTEWVRNELLNLVDLRYEAGLPTIYISNYPPSELAERLGRDDSVIGDRIVSRMQENAIQHRVKAPDRRLAAAAA